MCQQYLPRENKGKQGRGSISGGTMDGRVQEILYERQVLRLVSQAQSQYPPMLLLSFRPVLLGGLSGKGPRLAQDGLQERGQG